MESVRLKPNQKCNLILKLIWHFFFRSVSLFSCSTDWKRFAMMKILRLMETAHKRINIAFLFVFFLFCCYLTSLAYIAVSIQMLLSPWRSFLKKRKSNTLFHCICLPATKMLCFKCSNKWNRVFGISIRSRIDIWCQVRFAQLVRLVIAKLLCALAQYCLLSFSISPCILCYRLSD